MAICVARAIRAQIEEATVASTNIVTPSDSDMNRSRRRVLAAVLSAILGVAAVGARQTLPPVNQVPLSERLWLTVLDADKAHDYSASLSVEAKCGKQPELEADAGNWRSCRSREFKPTRTELAKLYAEPRGSSMVVATLVQHVSIPQGEVVVTYVLERTGRPGDPVNWPNAIEFADYGLHISGAQRRGNWVRLLSDIPVDGWLRTDDPAQRLRIAVDSIEGRVIGIAPLVATWPDGSQRRTGDFQTFLIQRISRGVILFRQEIPSDFDCGEPVVDPNPLPPVLRAPISALFNPNGAPRFADPYTKGC